MTQLSPPFYPYLHLPPLPLFPSSLLPSIPFTYSFPSLLLNLPLLKSLSPSFLSSFLYSQSLLLSLLSLYSLFSSSLTQKIFTLYIYFFSTSSPSLLILLIILGLLFCLPSFLLCFICSSLSISLFISSFFFSPSLSLFVSFSHPSHGHLLSKHLSLPTITPVPYDPLIQFLKSLLFTFTFNLP